MFDFIYTGSDCQRCGVCEPRLARKLPRSLHPPRRIHILCLRNQQRSLQHSTSHFHRRFIHQLVLPGNTPPPTHHFTHSLTPSKSTHHLKGRCAPHFTTLGRSQRGFNMGTHRTTHHLPQPNHLRDVLHRTLHHHWQTMCFIRTQQYGDRSLH